MKLNKKDAAIIIKEDGTREVILPKMKADENVTDNQLVVMAILFLLNSKSKNHKKFMKLIDEEIKGIFKKKENDK